ncbi:ATP-binding protein [Granulicella mallensis]|uniref:histidine kinase n=1 Tax=Granulicella mallensis (strain ATCC BAA-1857 / DSM 23137 / MP5ACTX8) TaxID=682795 RepID=G8NRG8_GRAMM|nr:ATP-binding protein [Granulicella mallensis]AEU37326.1 histidine kinase [Granulicella mallensis MP5ACTX8]
MTPSAISPHPVTSTLSPETIARLADVSILASLDETTLHCLDGATEVHLPAEEVLIQQGEAARFFWILLSGSITISNTSTDGQETTQHTMHQGVAFGEVQLLANIASAATYRAASDCELLQLDEEQFWLLMTSCPEVRKAILGNMAMRLAKLQATTFHQEKMASLGTLAAGLMHELNNPGAAARRASSQLRENLLRMHALTAKFSKTDMTYEQKQCMFDLQEFALGASLPQPLSSIEQADAEEALTAWMEDSQIEDAWKMAPTLVSIGIQAQDLEHARITFTGSMFSDSISWLVALISSMQLVGIVEESITRVTDLVQAVKSYAYEGRGEKQTIDVNASIHATLVILSHKIREKQLTLDKSFSSDLVNLQTECQGLNQIWTNLLDNAIDAAPQGGTLTIRTWTEQVRTGPQTPPRANICVMFRDNGPGIPPEIQSRIFDPFYTTKPVGVGTGLGLGIVFRIVEQCGGTLRFTSAPGDTEFVVRLPSTRA